MATSEENDLIGYDPLAWMEGGADKNEEATNDGYCDSVSTPEEVTGDNKIRMTDDYSGDLVGNTEKSAVLSALSDPEGNVTKEDETVIDEIEDESGSTLVEEMADDCMAATAPGMEVRSGDSAPEVGALSDTGEGAADLASEEMDGPLIDLDATLTIQNVVKLHEKLKNSLAVHDQIEINASDVSSIDTATLQLLVSLKKDAVKLQKKVTIIYPSPRFVESAQLLGLSDVLDIHDV